MRCKIGALAVAVAMLAPGAALADPRLDEVVYAPYVESHVAELELRAGREVGDGALRNAQTDVVEAEYGFNDRISAALVGSIARAPDAPSALRGVGLETIFYAGQIPKLAIDVGFYLEYTKGLHGEDDAVEGKILLAKTVDRFQGLANIIIEEPLGAPAGEDFASYGYAASATWRAAGAVRLGVEAFGDFGDDHGLLARPEGAYVGPQIKGELRSPHAPVEVEVDAGWLAAIGPNREEANSQARLSLEFARRF